MRTLWISLCASLIIASVVAQRNFNLSKPIVSFVKRPRSSPWQRAPEERRKSSIFPRNNKKFVVTPKAVVKTEEESVGLTTKRPVMRKFVVQDKSEEGPRYFKPRQSLMKTKRYTVTVAPQRLSEIINNSHNSINKTYAEKGEELKNIKTVVSHSKNEQLSKVHINKGKVIKGLQNNKENLTTVKGFKPVEKVVQEAKLNKYVSNLIPNSYFATKLMNSKTVSVNSVNVTQINHELENKTKTIKTIQSSPSLKTEYMLKETIEEKIPDFNEMEMIDNSERKLKIQARLSDKNNNSLNMDVLELLIENLKNDTKNLNVFTPARDLNINIANHTINYTIEDETHELDMRPNNFYEVKSFDNVQNYLDDTITQVSQALGSEDTNALSEIKDNVNKTSEYALIIDGLDSSIEYIGSDLNSDGKSKDLIGGKPQVPVEHYLTKDIFDDFTAKPVTITTEEKTSNFEPLIYEPDFNNGLQTKPYSNFIFDKVGHSSTEDNFVEIYTPDSLNSEKMSHKASVNKSNSEISDDLMHEHSNKTDEVLIDKSNNLTNEGISNESSTDRSNNFTGEEVLSEFMVEKSNNLTGEELSNESNITDDEVSNEYLIVNLTEETSDESLDEKSNKAVSNESIVESENIITEKIFTEALVNRYKRSHNIIEEENQAMTLSSFKYTGQPTQLIQDLSFKNINA